MTPAVSPTAPVAVFQGQSSTSIPLSWAQREMWGILRDLAPLDYVTSLGRVVEVPRRKIGVSEAATAIGLLIERYEVLRILIHGDDNPHQEVLARGSCALTVLETTAEQARAEARPLMERLRTVRFDLDRELPIRVGLVVVDGLVHFLAIAVSHCAVDGPAMDEIVRDLRLLLLRGAVPPPRGLGLVDLVASQQATGQRYTSEALAHWRDGLLRVPQVTFRPQREPAEPRYRYPVLTSAAMLGAAQRLASVHRTTTSTVLLAATCEAIAQVSGAGTCGLLLQISNRFRADCTAAAALVTQLGLLVVDVADRPSFHETIDRTAQAVVRAYRRAYFDPVAMKALEQEVVGLGGASIRSLPCFNDVRNGADEESFGLPLTAERIQAAAAKTTFMHMGTPGMCWFHFYLEIHQAPGAIKAMLIADAHHMSVSQIDNVLMHCEQRLIDAVGTR